MTPEPLAPGGPGPGASDNPGPAAGGVRGPTAGGMPGRAAGGMRGQTAGGRWDPAGVGVLALPSGRLVRGRGLRHPLPAGAEPQFAVHLLGRTPPAVAWESGWLRWPDFRLPADRDQAAAMLREVWERSAGERVEVACWGGRGRTGTALACIAVLDGVPAADAVAFVREHYHRKAVEMPWQHRYVRGFRR